MPPTAATPSKPSKRHRQKTKSTGTPQHSIGDLSDDHISRHIKSDLDLPDQETEGPQPPVPSASNPRTNDLFQDEKPVPAGDIIHHKQTPRKNRGSRKVGSSPLPKFSSTPQPDHRIKSLTPSKKNVTPSQAYAGPTFHASPAASSLPMPKFFSKSVPEVNKSPSMQSIVDKETTESSSEQSEGSPTPASARRHGEEQVREESPLDIFFHADRKQKERQRKEQAAVSEAQSPVQPVSKLDRPRYHTRHSTNGSMGAMFPLELENGGPAQISHEKAFSDPTTDTVDSKNVGPPPLAQAKETPEQFEQRKAKTIALKKLLMSSVPPMSDGSSSNIERATEKDTATHSISSSPRQKRASTSHIHKQIAAQTTRQVSPCPRPSSNLRKELSVPALPESEPTSELPATPPPSRTRNAYKSAPLDGASSPSPIPDFTKRSTPAPAEANVCSSPYKTMEDDLRRILKLDVFPSDSATRVRS